ncbi:hypothetical protein [Chryseobacterium sp. G0201]|uniref:hypothetical protein n=1 Tax=Chryseobacterium sp. G0201 TaxID=2487065 RepID=UPI000F50A5D1|nr:hypothetical protein [Chryseobacterium sp. G0201]AZA54795.1 hypothetical protein EG348_18205 [Chryseobacterium sp. G0201]
MRKNIIIVSTILISGFAFSQVGMNTPDPKATLDITAKNATGTSTSTEGILIPRVDRQRAQSMQNIEVPTLIYVNSVSTGSQTGNAINIDKVGYYYYKDSAWIKLNQDPEINTNIYNSDGTLSENRTVTQGNKSLKFIGSIENLFSVDGLTLSVDAARHRVGMGTETPSSILSVVNSRPGNTVDAFSVGINNCGSACGQGTARNISIFNKNGTNSQFGSIDFIPSITADGITGASIRGIDRNAQDNSAGLQFLTRNVNSYDARMTIKSAGNIGIGTSTPNPKAILDLSSTTQGFLPPRMTTAQRDQITSPVPPGLMVYNTTDNMMQYYNGSTWINYN